jgi:hypothetical protein
MRNNYNFVKETPLWMITDQTVGYWFDLYMLMAVKLYYWPAFTIGIQDNVADIFNPKTYSICRI